MPCLLCGDLHDRPDLDICPGCYHELPWLPAACPRCANPLTDTHTALCGQCQQQMPAFDRTVALFRYQPPLDRLILDLKFHGQLSHARLLGAIMAQHLEHHHRHVRHVDCLLPVPLHPQRLRERGFNQAIELARPLAKRLGIPIDSQHCQRQRPTHGQSALPLSKRAANIRNAFAVNPPPHWQHVAIIDDVMTSGHTVNALAMALKRQGVEEVSVWCCCRATTDQHR
ncbi:ComF family protein [Sulfuriflexus mobilis]|uniref:ComF family protein n=1 Tax=Sulfuriflexus mobilis TaxID=1811807 RepID=UPI001E3FA40F|nr:ComF family protein [Sulfuriflexus mobilis]